MSALIKKPVLGERTVWQGEGYSEGIVFSKNITLTEVDAPNTGAYRHKRLVFSVINTEEGETVDEANYPITEREELDSLIEALMQIRETYQ